MEEQEHPISVSEPNIDSNVPNKSMNIPNKGTGAGGANTNANGLSYEDSTDLPYKVIQKHKDHKLIMFEYSPKRFVYTKKSGLFRYMENKMNHQIIPAHGCKQPDECYIYEDGRNIYIIEKKFQQTGGSVCEKIQTSDMKKWQYERTFPDYKIIYIYCLSSWFRENCKAEIEYLNVKQIPVFWGDSETYKEDLIQFILNYK